MYNCTVKGDRNQAEAIHEELKKHCGVSSVYYEIEEGKLYEVKIFVYTKDESREVKDYLSGINGVKYNIVESV